MPEKARISSGDVFEVTADVQNVWATEATQEVSFEVQHEGTTVNTDSRSVTLNGGEMTTVMFTSELPSGSPTGDFLVFVETDDEEAGEK